MTTSKPHRAQGFVMLAVGVLVGFGIGYFAGGGGRPAPVGPAGASGATSDDMAELQKAVDRDPENPQLLTTLGNFYYDRSDWGRAAEAYEKARRKAPKDSNLLSDLGAAHRNQGEFELAVAFFQKARENDPDHWQSLLNWLLVEAYDRKNAVAAQRLYDEVKQRYPEIPQIDRIQEQIKSIRTGSLMGKLILLVVVVFFFLTVLRGLRIFFAAVFRPAGGAGAARAGGTREGEMVRDPVCGTWIDRGIAVFGRKGAESVPVCSDECRRRLEAAP